MACRRPRPQHYIPPESRQGFDYWKVLECTHDYNNSRYYAGDSGQPLMWDGYDAIEQTQDVQSYLRGRKNEDKSNTPFLLVLSWGPPHAPYETAPEAYREMYDPAAIELRPNVPPEMAEEARDWIAGYYAHCTALDDCLGALLQTLEEEGLAENTIFVFTSDHGEHARIAGRGKEAAPLGGIDPGALPATLAAALRLGRESGGCVAGYARYPPYLAFLK